MDGFVSKSRNNRATIDASTIAAEDLVKFNDIEETGLKLSAGNTAEELHHDLYTRNSPSYDEMEHELNDLIEEYQDSIQHDNPKYEDFSSTFGPYAPSSKDHSILEHLTVSGPGNASPLSDYPIVSTLPNFYVSETSPPLSPSSLPRSAFRTPGITHPSSLTSPISLNGATFKNVYLPAFGKSTATHTPDVSDHNEPPALYDTSFSILPFNDSTNFQMDETLTFKKMVSTGISSRLSKQISFLLFELNRLKETNEKLNDELKSCKNELNSARNQIILANSNAQLEPDNEKLSGIIEDIYRAQRTRDMAMIERLKEANRLKTDAINESLIQHRIPINRDDIITRLIKTQSLHDLKASTSKLLRAVADEKDRKKIIAGEEIEAILFERDLIQKQKKDVERERNSLVTKLKNETQSRNDLQRKLHEVEKDKNEYMNKANSLENKLKNIGISQNLYKSLSKEEQLHQQFSSKLAQLSIELENRNKQWKSAKLETDHLRAKSHQDSEDNSVLTSRCNKLEHELKEEKGNIERLNRLVGVLRRKLREGSSNTQS